MTIWKRPEQDRSTPANEPPEHFQGVYENYSAQTKEDQNE
jgi:hypothetical protein